MKRFLLGIFSAALLSTGSLHAIDSEAGTAASNILTLQGGARPAAMGGAYVGVSDDINAVYHNPAGLGFVGKTEFAATQFNGFADLKVSDIALAIPLGDVTTSNVRPLGTIVISVARLDYGNTEAFDVAGNSAGRVNGVDDAWSFGWGKALTERFALGVVGRAYSLEIFREQASGMALDVGSIFRIIPGYLQFGFAASNLGSKIQYAARSEDSPVEYTGGVGFTPLGDRMTLALDIGAAEDRGSIVRLGGEFHISRALCLRAGYDTSYDAGSGITFGAGIQLLDLEVGFFPIDRVGLDYAFAPADDLDSSHRVALTARIGTQ